MSSEMRAAFLVPCSGFSMAPTENFVFLGSRFVTIQQHILSIVHDGLLAGDCVYFPPQTGSTDGLDKRAGKF
jgi:hypothetical protein